MERIITLVGQLVILPTHLKNQSSTAVASEAKHNTYTQTTKYTKTPKHKRTNQDTNKTKMVAIETAKNTNVYLSHDWEQLASLKPLSHWKFLFWNSISKYKSCDWPACNLHAVPYLESKFRKIEHVEMVTTCISKQNFAIKLSILVLKEPKVVCTYNKINAAITCSAFAKYSATNWWDIC